MGLLVSINGADFEPYASAEVKPPLVGRKQSSQKVDPVRREMDEPGEFERELQAASPKKRAHEAYEDMAQEKSEPRHKKAVHADELMTSPVHCLKEGQTVAEALELFQGEEIQHAPVVNADGLITGMLSDRNLLMAEKSSQLKEHMSRDIVAAQAKTLLSEITRAMLDHRFHSVPILSDKKPIGIITSTDILESVLLNPNIDLFV